MEQTVTLTESDAMILVALLNWRRAAILVDLAIAPRIDADLYTRSIDRLLERLQPLCNLPNIRGE